MTVLEQLTRRTTQHDRRLSALEAQETASGRDPVWAYMRAQHFIMNSNALRAFWNIQYNVLTNNRFALSMHNHSATYPTFYRDPDRWFPFVRLRRAQTQYLDDTDAYWSFDSGAWQGAPPPGLTAGAWIKPSTVSGNSMGVISAWDQGASNESWILYINSNDRLSALTSSTGTSVANNAEIMDPDPVPNGRWLFTVYRWTPSTELKVWLFDGDTTYTDIDTTSIVSSLYYDGGLTGHVGAYRDGASSPQTLDGDISLYFWAVSAWTDAEIQKLFDISRHIYGV